MKIVAVNLISFSNTKAVGTLVYTRRLFEEIFRLRSAEIQGQIKWIIYIQQGLDIQDFGFPCSIGRDDIEVVVVPKFKASIVRIFFEQTLFYRYLCRADYFFTPSLSLPLFATGKRITTLHDMIPFFDNNKYGKIRTWYVKVMTKLVAMKSWKILTVSKNSKSDILKYLKIPKDKVIIIYNFIPEHEIIKDERRDIVIHKNGEFDLKQKFFLTVSTLQPGKNLERLIDAFIQFQHTHTDYYLCIVGGFGWNVAPILTKIRELDINKRIILMGYQSDEVLSAMYYNCQAVVYVSLYEGFGIPPLEGFMYGKLCVGSNVSSIPEVVGDAGILVDPYSIDDIKNGMEQILISENLRDNIKIQIDKFSPDRQVDIFLNLFN